jgi:hypothetical protein
VTGASAGRPRRLDAHPRRPSVQHHDHDRQPSDQHHDHGRQPSDQHHDHGHQPSDQHHDHGHQPSDQHPHQLGDRLNGPSPRIRTAFLLLCLGVYELLPDVRDLLRGRAGCELAFFAVALVAVELRGADRRRGGP